MSASLTPLQALALADIGLTARYPDSPGDDYPRINLRPWGELMEVTIRSVFFWLDKKGSILVQDDRGALIYGKVQWIPDPQWPDLWKFTVEEVDGINDDAYDPTQSMVSRVLSVPELGDFIAPPEGLDVPREELMANLIRATAGEIVS